MKKILLVCAALLSAGGLSAQYRSGAVYESLYDSETVKTLKGHVSYLASAALEGRRAGSEGEAMAADYVEETLRGYGVDLISPRGGEVFGLRREQGDTLTSRNVAGFVQGYDESLYDRYIVIGARMDNLGMDSLLVNGERRPRICYGANGNASGLALLLELGRLLQVNRPLLRRSVLLVAFGASEENFAGAWYFLHRSFSDADHIEAMINLDVLGGGSEFYAYTASNADMNSLVTALSRDLQPVLPQVIPEEPYPSDQQVFYAAEIPSVLFTTGKYPEHDTERDTPAIVDYSMMERELEYLYHYAVAAANGPAPVFNPAAEAAKRSALPGTVSFYDTDIRPSFLGRSDPRAFLERWVYQYLKYPEEAVEKGIQGRVQVDFVIDETGKVTDVKVSRSVDPLIDAEAVRVVSASPRWKPGRVNGKNVKTSLTLPVDFRLTKKGKFGINNKVL